MDLFSPSLGEFYKVKNKLGFKFMHISVLKRSKVQNKTPAARQSAQANNPQGTSNVTPYSTFGKQATLETLWQGHF